MGQIVKRKKKGRPPKADLASRDPPPEEGDLRRSLRRRNVKYVFDLDDYFDDDGIFEDDEDQRRREKKLKHLLKLQGGGGGGEPESTSGQQSSGSRRVAHAPPSSPSSSEDGPSKKRRISEEIEEDVDDENDDVDDEENYNDEEDEEVKERKPEPKAEDSPQGSPEEAANGLPLPDKRILELIVDKLQKKDIYGVYAEPVDPEELPDYHDIIKNPMDFATVRNKLGNGSYATFEEFESDVFLICSNAMQYNAPDTIYHKQARSIQELAKKKFCKIRLNIERSEKDIKPEQKLRSYSISKQQIKRSVSRTVQKPVGSDFSSGATLSTTFDIQNISNALQAVGYERAGCLDGIIEANSFFNENNLEKGEETLPGKAQLSKFGRKASIYDDNRRGTYTISLTQPLSCSESIFSTFDEESKLLIPVGLYSDHSYARSLARFAATLGSVAWRVASRRIEEALPQGYKYGRGWVGEYEPLPTPVLIVENCNVKEPPFLSKINPTADAKKIETIPKASKSSKDSPRSVFFLDKSLPFLGPASKRPPSSPVATAPLPLREQQVRGDVSEAKPSFFSSPGIKPSGSSNLNYEHKNSQPGILESDKKVLKKVELTTPASVNKYGADPTPHKHPSKSSDMEPSRSMEFAFRNVNFPPSGSFKQPDSNGGAREGLPNGKVVANRLDGNSTACSSSDSAKTPSYYHHDQGQGLSDPVQLMRKLTENARIQQTTMTRISDPVQSMPSAPQVLSSATSASNDPNNAAAAAARAWMSVGAGGFRPIGENSNLHKDQIYADSLYNPTRSQPQVSRFCGEFPASVMHTQPDKSVSPAHAFVPQGPMPVRVGNELHFQNQQMVFPQFMNADLSRFQQQPTWRNVNMQMHSRQQPDSLPPDLNIDFQSSGSPGRPASDVLIDSQQPDLALQL